MKLAILQVLLLSKLCSAEVDNFVGNIDEIQNESVPTLLEDSSVTRFDAIESMMSSLNFLLNKMIASRQNQDISSVDYSNHFHLNSNNQALPCSTKSQELIHSNLRGSVVIVSRSQASPNMRQHEKENIQLEGFYDSSSGSSSGASSGSAAYGDYAGYYYGDYGYYGEYGDYGYYYDYEGPAEEDVTSSSPVSDGEDETSTSVSVQSDADATDSVLEISTENEIEPIAPLSNSLLPHQQLHRVFEQEQQQTRLRKVRAPHRVFVQEEPEVKPHHVLLARGLLDSEKELKKEAKHVAKEEKIALIASKTENKLAEKQAKSDSKTEKVAAHAAKKANKTFQQDVHSEELQ